LDLYPDHQAVVERCERARVFTLAVTTTPKAWQQNEALTRKTRYVRAALGLHPQLIAERADEFGLWEALLPNTRYIGEVGLDAGPRFYRSLELQKQIFERVLKACARAGDKILTIHSVRAVRSVLDMIERFLPATKGQVVMHWFTGTKGEARRAIDLGCYFSVNAAMLSNPRHRALVAELPMRHLLTETDGPFTRTSGRSTDPTDVGLAVQELGLLRGLDESETASVIRSNLRRLLSEQP